MSENEPKRNLSERVTIDNLLSIVGRFSNTRWVNREPFLINIAGQSAVGKSTISALISTTLQDCLTVDMDDYLRGWEIGLLNHDSGDPNKPFFAGLNPEVYDLSQLYSDIMQLRDGRSIEKPVFDEVKKRRGGTRQLQPSKIIIVDGIYALNSPFSELANLSILVEAPLHDRLMRKIIRNHIFYREEVDDIAWRYLSRDEPTYAFYREDLYITADVIVENPANPIIDYYPLLQIRDTVPTTNCNRATPQPEHGILHPLENLSFIKTPEETILEYKLANKLLVRGSISTNTYDLIQQFYTVKEE